MLLHPTSNLLRVFIVCHVTVILPCAIAKAVLQQHQQEGHTSGVHPADQQGSRLSQSASSKAYSGEESNVIITQQNGAKEQALGELLRVFGLENNTLEEPARRPEPPPFMLNLYSSVADPASGESRMPSPFNANTVRSLPDKAGKERLHFQFNLSQVPSTEILLHAELHLFKLKPKMRPTVSGRRQPFYQIQLYQLATADVSSLEGAKLIGLRLVGTVGTEWEVFSITDSVSNWLADERQNFGVLVTITSLTGEPMKENFIRFAQNGKHHPSKHPFLVLYTNDLRQSEHPLKDQDSADTAYETFFQTYGNINAPPFMDATKAGPTPNVGTNRYTAATTTRQTRTGATSRHRRDNQRDNLDESPTEDTNGNREKASTKGLCTRRSMYVDFHEIGWSDWIIYPNGYNARECHGNCPFPIGQTVQPSNHATVQSLMHLIAADVAAPCCVPSQLDPIAVLFFDGEDNVILKQFDNMVATACGCR